MFRHVSLIALLAGSVTAAMAAEPLIWIEGEQPVKKQLVDNAGLNDVNPDELSGGKWIHCHPIEMRQNGWKFRESLPQGRR